MASGDVANAKFCSPLLVNAMCAFAAVSMKLFGVQAIITNVPLQFTSLYVEAIDSANATKMRQKFFNEARKLYDNSRGKASLTSVQSLLILYLFSNGDGMDRAGLIFRMSAAGMYKRLRLGSHLPSWCNAQQGHRRAFSRNAWGCFALER
jgi:hypothetical protein